MNTSDQDQATQIEDVVAEAEQKKMSLDVQIEDIGPCKKHIRVTVGREDISHHFDLAVGELSSSASVPGFRIGHVPRKLLEKRFRKELTDQVKQQIVVKSLEQLSDDNDLDPINEPNIDLENIDLPETGDFEYEFDVEVRPEFELPDYQGLKIKRPVREVGDQDVDDYLRRYLAQYGHLMSIEEPAESRDYVVVSATIHHQDEVLHKSSELTLCLKPVLRFQDAEIDNFDLLMKGAKPGETREVETTVSLEAEAVEMRGESVLIKFEISEVKRLSLPEMDKEFLQRIHVESEEDLRKEIRDILDRQVTYQQRQATRSEVLNKITESANWDLPEQLVLRQVENALRREILEMQQAGFTTQQIQARENELRQRAVSSTRQALKEHFVLDRIATREEIQVTPADIDTEIKLMAMQRGESSRRVRARLVKSGMIENLEAQIRERKAVDFILDQAEFEDVDMEPFDEDRIEAVAYSVCGFVAQAENSTESETETQADQAETEATSS